MIVFNSFMFLAIVVLFVVNVRNQSGIVALKKEVIALKKMLKQLQMQYTQRTEEVIQSQLDERKVDSYEASAQVSSKNYAEADVEAQAEEQVEAHIETQVEEQVEAHIEAQVEAHAGLQSEIFTETSMSKKKMAKSTLFSIESIISKLGILLFLIGVGYLYKLAYDNGYITQGLAIVFGEAIGVCILGLGGYVQRKNRHILSQVLFGGGIATLFIVTYVAYNNYHVITGFVALFLFIMITIIAFYIALAIDSKTMSVVGVLGGLLTPFMVDIEYLGFFGVGIYLLVLSVGAMSMYLFKRWRVLQISAICGVYFVTLLLLANGNFSEKESVQFSLLLVALFFLFNGLDYVLFYREFETKRHPIVTPILFITIPIISMIQWVELLDLTKTQWSVLFMLYALVFMAAYIGLYARRGQLLVTDILISFVGVFTLVSVILYFGGDVRIIGITILSILFYVLSHKMKNRYINYVGHFIFCIGFLWAFVEFFISIDEGFSVISLVVQFIILLLMTCGAFIQKGITRKVQGTIILVLYGLSVLLRLASELGKNAEPIVIIMLTIGIYLWLLWLLMRKTQLVSLISLSVLSIVPFLAQFIANSQYIGDADVPVSVIILSVIYCINLYGFARIMLKDTKPMLGESIKIVAYSMFIINTLVHMLIRTEHFGYGLCIVGLFIWALNIIEKNQDRLLRLFLYGVNIGYIVLLVLYGLLQTSNTSINYLVFFVDLVILVILYFIIKQLALQEEIQVIIHLLCYMLLIYHNLNAIDKGTITLFWAAYGIVSLFVFVYFKKRNTTYIALGMIIFVAAKFILVDLSFVDTIYKVITSMAFGIALLILSYVIQPLLSQEKDE